MKDKKYPFVEAYCKGYGLPEPVREHRFWPGRKFAFDFAWPDSFVALEVEGGLFLSGGGRHNRGASMRKDMEKYNEAAVRGWIVLRVTPEQLKKNMTYELLQRAIDLSAGGHRPGDP